MTRTEALKQLQRASDSLRLVASGSFSTRLEAAQLYDMKDKINRIASNMTEREEMSE